MFDTYNRKRLRKPTWAELGTIFGAALFVLAEFVREGGLDALYFSPLILLAALFALYLRISRSEDEI